MSHHKPKSRKSRSSRQVEALLDTKYDENDPSSFDELLADLTKSKNLVKKKDGRIKQLEHDLEVTNSKFNDAQERVEELEDLKEKLESELETARNRLDTIDPDKQNKDALDKMDAMIDDLKQQATHFQTKYEEQQDLSQRMRQKYESLNIQFQQQTKRLQAAQAKTETSVKQVEMHFQQRIETMKSLNAAEVKSLRNQLDLVRRQQNASRSKENEDIQASLRELAEQHETIEKDLQKQIDDTKEMMIQREKSAQQLVEQVNQQFDEYKEMAEQEILELKERLVSYEIDGQVEIILQIDVDGMDATNYEQNWQRVVQSQAYSNSALSLSTASAGPRASVVRKPTVGGASSISGSSDVDAVSNGGVSTSHHRASVHRPPPKKPAPLLPIHNKNNSQASFNSYHSRQSSVVSDISNHSDNPKIGASGGAGHEQMPDLGKQQSTSLLIPKSVTNVIQKANPLSLLSAKSMTSLESGGHDKHAPSGASSVSPHAHFGGHGSGRNVEFTGQYGRGMRRVSSSGSASLMSPTASGMYNYNFERARVNLSNVGHHGGLRRPPSNAAPRLHLANGQKNYSQNDVNNSHNASHNTSNNNNNNNNVNNTNSANSTSSATNHRHGGGKKSSPQPSDGTLSPLTESALMEFGARNEEETKADGGANSTYGNKLDVGSVRAKMGSDDGDSDSMVMVSSELDDELTVSRTDLMDDHNSHNNQRNANNLNNSNNSNNSNISAQMQSNGSSIGNDKMMGASHTSGNTDILSRMKSKLLTSFQHIPQADTASVASYSSQSVRASGMPGYGLNSPQTPTPGLHYQRNGYPKKPASVRSAVSAYSGTGGANGGHSPSGSIISGSDVDRYIAIGKGSSKLQLMMYQQDNAKLAENLKMAHQKNMVMKEQSQRKYKQLQLTLTAERATWNSKTKEYTDRILELERSKNETELLLKERTMQLQNLETQFNQLKAQVSLQQMEQMHQASNWQQAASASNRGLVQQVEHYRVQLSQARNQLLAANNTMRAQNDQINKLKNKLTLEHKTAEALKNQIAQRETTSAEELLEQQVKLLKNQRRMLIHEVRDLREQNERLKNMVVTGGVHISKDNQGMFDSSK